VDSLLCNTAEDPALQATFLMTAHDDQINMLELRLSENGQRGKADSHFPFGIDSREVVCVMKSLVRSIHDH
jgi:hypothetical protein